MKESLIKTPVDLLLKPIMELVSSSPPMRARLSLRLPDVYDLLQIFLNEAGSQEFVVLVCGSVFRGAD